MDIGEKGAETEAKDNSGPWLGSLPQWFLPYALGALLFLTFLAKGPAFLHPLPSVDAWYYLSHLQSGEQRYDLLLQERRYGQIVLVWLGDLFGYRTIAVASSSVLLAALLSVLSAMMACAFLAGDRLSASLAIAAGAIFCLHPTTIEIFTFSDVTLDVYLSLACGLGALRLLQCGRSLLRDLSAVLLIAFAISIYQVTLSILAVLICLDLARAVVEGRGASPALRPAFILLASLLVYLGLGKVIALVSLPPSGRASIAGMEVLLQRGPQLMRALSYAFYPPERWVTRATTLVYLSALGLSAFFLLRVSFRKAGIAGGMAVVLLLAGGVFATIILAVIGENTSVALRVLTGAGAFGAGLVLLGSIYSPRNGGRAIIGLAAVASVGFIASSNRVLFDQRQRYLWDTAKANRILARLEEQPDYTDMRTVVPVSSRGKKGEVALKTRIGALNMSAFGAWYARTPLMERATGRKFLKPAAEEVAEAENFCASAPKWPAEGSVGIVDSVGAVCL